MKKLAYLANFFPSLTETFIYREVMELQRRRIPVTVYSLRRPPTDAMSVEALPLSRETRYLLPVPLPLLVGSHLRALLRPVRYFSTLVRMLTATHASWRDRIRTLMHFGEGVVLAGLMTRDGITHVHAHYASQSTSVARVVHLMTGIPYSFTGHAHDIWHDQLMIPEKIGEATFVATCSEFARGFLNNIAGGSAGDKVHLVYHGLDTRRFLPPEGEEGRVKNLVLSVGSLGETKGFPDLIRACSLLRGSGFPFSCIIAGEGPQRRELEELIASLGLEGLVSLPGAVTQEKICELYRQSWVFALPCIMLDDGRKDGLPNVLLEAMACGLPVITTGTTARSELVVHGENGWLVPPHAPEELASAIIHLCSDMELRAAIRNEARRVMVEKFDNRKTIEPLLELFARHVFDGRDMTALRDPDEWAGPVSYQGAKS